MDSKNGDSPEDDELRDIIEQALKFNVQEKKTFKKRKDLAGRVGSILSEYLDSYILLGYDFDGRHLDIKSATTPMHAEALNSFLIKYFAVEAQQFKSDSNGPDTHYP
tara:strand:- start:421 stop:741 length:321 start_codon:yes stop_codon:yes gene_type:complete